MDTCRIDDIYAQVSTTVETKQELWPEFRRQLESLMECLLGDRDEPFVNQHLSGFDITRKFDDLINLSQILIKLQSLKAHMEGHFSASSTRWLLPTVAFLCFIQWMQDNHCLADEHDEDIAPDGSKKEVEEIGNTGNEVEARRRRV